MSVNFCPPWQFLKILAPNCWSTIAAYLNTRHCVHLCLKSPSVSFWVLRQSAVGGFLFLSIISVLICFLLGAESWPSDIIFPRSTLIKGRNDKNWLCSDRNLPWQVLLLRSSLSTRRLVGSVMRTPSAWDLMHRLSSWWYKGGGWAWGIAPHQKRDTTLWSYTPEAEKVQWFLG